MGESPKAKSKIIKLGTHACVGINAIVIIEE